MQIWENSSRESDQGFVSHVRSGNPAKQARQGLACRWAGGLASQGEVAVEVPCRRQEAGSCGWARLTEGFSLEAEGLGLGAHCTGKPGLPVWIFLTKPDLWQPQEHHLPAQEAGPNTWASGGGPDAPHFCSSVSFKFAV